MRTASAGHDYRAAEPTEGVDFIAGGLMPLAISSAVLRALLLWCDRPPVRSRTPLGFSIMQQQTS